ncbi:MAG: hypothetical protein MRERV_17c004 [Mycoplasmataceae bacterium RV_VA103A]|nr:MAG: hypothetical protein MRERV_33c020 [Mycoplasmataceae bacterium RV_VA103A]KLL04570.1 MAG: hypothetical protein MRERV_17c004 [Mycoplasmataceae bacterium RV_VA103A]
MRIIQNPPCWKCSPSENKKHCFSHGLCEVEFTGNTTYKGKEIYFCSPACELDFHKFRFISNRKLYDVKY